MPAAVLLRLWPMTAFTQRALTDSDAAAFVALTHAIADSGGGEFRVDEARFRYDLHHPLRSPEFDDFQGVFDGDRLIAHAHVMRRDAADPVHWMQSDGGVHPEYLGRGIGTGLVRRQVETARRIHEHCFPGHPLELAVRVAQGNDAGAELFANEGYAPDRWFFRMLRPADVPEPRAALPTGLELETYTDAVREELRLVHNETFREHWHAVPHSAEDWAAFLAQDAIRRDLSFLLRDPANGAIAGYVLTSFAAADFQATGVRDLHFNVIGTPRAYRGRGLASSLIAHTLLESRRSGFETASLGVDAENPTGALGVYERAGFGCVRKTALYVRKLG